MDLDSKESFYHGFLAGLLKTPKKYQVVSNHEAGESRYDILLKDCMECEKAYLFERKAVDSFAKIEKAYVEVILQIDERRYEEDLKLDGYEITNSFAVVFARKRCLFCRKYRNRLLFRRLHAAIRIFNSMEFVWQRISNKRSNSCNR